MRIVVTGGAGYIGGHTLIELLAGGHQILVIDDLSSGSLETLDAVRSISGRDFEFARGDIRDEGFLKRVLLEFRPDGVVHMAGLKSPIESMRAPLTYFDVNLTGSINLLSAMEQSGCYRMVFSSSATVYGEPIRLPFDEEHRTAPATPYGRTKLVVEGLIQDWVAATGAKAISLRYFNPIGAHSSGKIGDRPKGSAINLMPYIVAVAARQRDVLNVYGTDFETRDGSGERDYVHVCDVARAHVAALEALDQLSGHSVVNIGRGESTSVLELVKAFETATATTVPWRAAMRRPEDLPSAWADVTRAHTLLGWRAQLTIPEMCVDAWRFNAGRVDVD